MNKLFMVAATVLVLSSTNAFAGDVDLDGKVKQTTVNYGDVVNTGTITTGGTVNGTGASLSVSASGATSAVSVSSVNNTVNYVDIAGVKQTTTNGLFSDVTNTGVIRVGSGIIGNGASAAVSASGATSAVVVSTVK